MKRRRIIIYIIIGLIIFAGLAAFILNKYFKVSADTPQNNAWVYYEDKPNKIYHYYQGQYISYTIRPQFSNIDLYYFRNEYDEYYNKTTLDNDFSRTSINIATIDTIYSNNVKNLPLAVAYQKSSGNTAYGSIIISGILTNDKDPSLEDPKGRVPYETMGWQIKSNDKEDLHFNIYRITVLFNYLKLDKTDAGKKTMDYYKYVAAQFYPPSPTKTQWIVRSKTTDSSKKLPDGIHESCENKLPEKNISYENMPSLVKQNLNSLEKDIQQKTNNNNFKLVKNEKEQREINSYINSLKGAFGIKNNRDPLENEDSVKSVMVSQMNNLFADNSAIWQDEDFKAVDKTAFRGCAWSMLIPAGLTAYSGNLWAAYGVEAAGSVACAGLSNQLAKLVSKHWNDEFRLSAVKSNFLLYYTGKYTEYLNCIKENPNTPPEYKERIEKLLKDLGSRINVLTTGIAEGTEALASSQNSSFWDSIQKEFNNTITDLMKKMMVWVWSFVSAAPL